MGVSVVRAQVYGFGVGRLRSWMEKDTNTGEEVVSIAALDWICRGTSQSDTSNAFVPGSRFSEFCRWCIYSWHHVRLLWRACPQVLFFSCINVGEAKGER